MKGIYIHISITSITILWSITKFLQEIGNIQHFWNSSKKVIMISIGVILMMLIILMIWIWNRRLKNVIFIRWKLMKVGTAHAFPTLRSATFSQTASQIIIMFRFQELQTVTYLRNSFLNLGCAQPYSVL